MKLTIFLDIDGVLNHEPKTEDCGDRQRMVGDRGWVILCSACIERLNKLIGCAMTEADYSDVAIILSSTWRHYFGCKELGIVMGAFGYNFRIDGKTARNELSRGQQILDYTKAKPTDAFIVLDDDTFDMDLVKDNQVVTDYRTGFDEQSLTEAIRLILEKRDQ